MSTVRPQHVFRWARCTAPHRAKSILPMLTTEPANYAIIRAMNDLDTCHGCPVQCGTKSSTSLPKGGTSSPRLVPNIRFYQLEKFLPNL